MSEKFHAMQGNERSAKLAEVEGETVAFSGFGDWQFFVYEFFCDWHVCEASTGFSCSKACKTKAKAISTARGVLKRTGIERFGAAVKAARALQEPRDGEKCD